MVLTGPQAIAIGAAALTAWAVRTPLTRLCHFLWWGPDLWWDEPDDDGFVDFVGANPDLYLGPENGDTRG